MHSDPLELVEVCGGRNARRMMRDGLNHLTGGPMSRTIHAFPEQRSLPHRDPSCIERQHARDRILSLSAEQQETLLHECCERRDEFDVVLFRVLHARHPMTGLARFATAPASADMGQVDIIDQRNAEDAAGATMADGDCDGQ